MTITLLREHRGAAGGPRQHRVRCTRYGKRRPAPRCTYAAYRTADTIEQALARPCPRCGEPVEMPLAVGAAQVSDSEGGA